jgi:hypothetical protein
MKIKVYGDTPDCELPGVGLVQTNEWFEVTPEQEAAFEMIHGYPLSSALAKGYLESDAVAEADSEPKPRARKKPAAATTEEDITEP